MGDLSGMIEAQELSLMQGWMHRDPGAIRRLAARDFMMIIGTNPPELLDRPSFVAAMEKDFRCIGFRLGESVVRRHGRSAWYTAGAELELKLDGSDWSGKFLITGLWYKFRIGGWKLIERSLCPTESDNQNAIALRRLQMWH